MVDNSQRSLKKNSEYVVIVDSLDNRGYGVGRVNGIVVFVNGALPGETVSVRIIKCAKNYCVGKLLRIIEKSKNRIEPKCPYFAQCGGCSLQHLTYDAQLKMKEESVKNALEHIGGFTEVDTKSIIPSREQFRYRNKASFPIGKDGSIGFYKRKSHEIIACEDCLLQNEITMQACRTIEAYIKRFNVSVYDENNSRGLLRHIVTRTNNDNQIHITIVATQKSLPHSKELIIMLKESVPSIIGVTVNVNRRKDNVILGNDYYQLYGEETIEEKVFNYSFDVSSASFFQINQFQIEKLYSIVVDYLKKQKARTVLDLYCGTGTITTAIANECDKVIGVEIVEEAVKNAINNAKKNNIQNVEFICGKAEIILPSLIKEFDVDTIVVDPPRSGCDISLIESIINNPVKRFIYVSCNPTTLARDMKLLSSGGYHINYVQPVDMFPMTEHVETVVLMSRVDR